MSVARAAIVLLALVAPLLSGFRTERAALGPSPRVRIPAGHFDRGSDTAAVHHALALCDKEHRFSSSLGHCDASLFSAELPYVRVYVPSFEIDRLEVTRAEYARCTRAGACPPPHLGAGDDRIGRPTHPVVGVSAHDAEDYCRFVGGRLPSDDEWEKAARGDLDARNFPWGDLFDPKLANHGGAEGSEAGDHAPFLAPVGSYPDGASPYGVFDLAGNVWEWTSSAFTPGMRVRPAEAGGAVRTIRGGSFKSSAMMLRVSYRVGLASVEYAPDLGFRCAYDLFGPG